jgi:hypothetical protein
MTASMIDEMLYYINDPILTEILPAFTSSRTYLSPIYELLNIDGTELDPKIFTFNPSTLLFTVSATSKNAIGSYPLQLKATFDPSLAYSVSSSFSVTILHNCDKNVISAPQILSDYNYLVADPTYTLKLPSWK